MQVLRPFRAQNSLAPLPGAARCALAPGYLLPHLRRLLWDKLAVE